MCNHLLHTTDMPNFDFETNEWRPEVRLLPIARRIPWYTLYWLEMRGMLDRPSYVFPHSGGFVPRQPRGRPCCKEVVGSTDGSRIFITQDVRTLFGRPNSSIRFRTLAAMATSVDSVSSVRDRSESPITRLNRPIAASTLARIL